MFRATHECSKTRLAAAGLPLACAGAARALEYSGDVRAGPGLTSGHASRACHAMHGGSSGMEHRPGHECDFCGEFQHSQPFKKGGIAYRATLMVHHDTGANEPAAGQLLDRQGARSPRRRAHR